MSNNYCFVSKSLDDTQQFAKKFAKGLKVGDVVTLTGDLGAGKTTFVKYLCQELGVKDIVSSPTFTIINEYFGAVKVYHLDMYRLDTLDEALMTGVMDVLNACDGVYFVEWPQVILSILPKHRKNISISLKDGSREFFVEEL